MNQSTIKLNFDQLFSLGYTPDEIELAVQACQISGSTSQLETYLMRAKSEYDQLKQIVDIHFLDSFIEKYELPDVYKYNKPKLRQPDQPLGLQNLSSLCYFNCLIQYLFHNNQIMTAIFNYKVQNNEDRFINLICSLQRLFSNLLISNKTFADQTEVFQFLCWEQQDRQMIGYQQDFRESFELVMEKLDQTLSCQEKSVQNNKQNHKACYKSTLLQDQFEIDKVTEKQNQTMIVGNLKYGNIYHLLYQEFKGNDKILKYPQNLLISIQRYNFSKSDQEVVKLSDKFILTKEIFVDFISNNNLVVNQLFDTFIYGNQIDPKYIQQQLNAFHIVSQFYKQTNNQQMVIQLEKDIEIFQNNLNIENNKGNINWLQNQLSKICKIKYYLQSVVIHKGQAQFGHYYIYIFNFNQQIWFKFNDSVVTQIDEKEMMFDAQENAYVVNYISEQQKDIQNNYEETRALISNYELDETFRENINLLSQIPLDIFQNILKENEKTKQ